MRLPNRRAKFQSGTKTYSRELGIQKRLFPVKCPITSEEVFPNLAELTRLGADILFCPSCGQKHRLLKLAEKLVEIIEPDERSPDDDENST